MDKMNSLEDLYKKLLEIKEESGATYEMMSAKIGISYATLWHWLHEGIKKINPSSKKLLLHFIEKYDLAKKEGRVFQFFGEF